MGQRRAGLAGAGETLLQLVEHTGPVVEVVGRHRGLEVLQALARVAEDQRLMTRPAITCVGQEGVLPVQRAGDHKTRQRGVGLAQLGLLNTLAALVFSGLISGFSILLMRNFFAGVPYDLWESAKLDGAGDFHIFRTIYLPLSQAGLATIALFEMVGRWNQFLPVILYISDSSKYTLQVALQALVTENLGTSGTAMVTPNVRMAGIVIAIVPLVVIYPFMQRYFVQGITLGSVKE